MDSMTENLLFERAFSAHSDHVLQALEDESYDFQDALQLLLRDLQMAALDCDLNRSMQHPISN